MSIEELITELQKYQKRKKDTPVMVYDAMRETYFDIDFSDVFLEHDERENEDTMIIQINA